MAEEPIGAVVARLRAALDEDEAVATAAKGILGVENPWWKWENLKARFPTLTRGDAQHIERHSPYRVLARVAAYQAILDAFPADPDGPDGYVEFAEWSSCSDSCAADVLERVIRLLAASLELAEPTRGT